MSRTKPDEAERRMMEFDCDTCGALPSEWCRVIQRWRTTCQPASLLHAKRFWTATAAGRLPLLPVGAASQQADASDGAE